MKPLDEQEEAWALQLVANGSGSWPLKEHPRYDEAVVSFLIEELDEVQVFLRRQGATLQQYRFRLSPAQATGSVDGKNWLKRQDPGDSRKARAWFRKAGLPIPRVPHNLRKHFVELEDGIYTTRPIQRSPYELLRFLNEAHADIVPDYAILAYHGDEEHDKMLHYYLRRGPLDLFLQLKWSRQADESVQDNIKKCFGVADQIVDAMKTAERESRVGSKGRLKIACSDRFGCAWSTSPIEELTQSKKPLEVLTEAHLWITSRTPPFNPSPNTNPPPPPTEDPS